MRQWLLLMTLILTLVSCGSQASKDTETKEESVQVVEVDEYSYVLVEGGTFNMGYAFGDEEEDEKPTHNVTLDSFYMSKYEVTQKEYMELMDYNPSKFSGDNLPVEQITWYDTVVYANKLSEKRKLKPYYNINSVTKDGNAIIDAQVTIIGGKGYRLPTESEWEYAAKGGKLSKSYMYSGSNNVDEVAWYASNSNKKTQIVGKKKANELGIHDMSGNVYEWCWNGNGSYSSSYKTNTTGDASSAIRVSRGGSWGVNASFLPVTDIYYSYSYNYGSLKGFRLVKSY